MKYQDDDGASTRFAPKQQGWSWISGNHIDSGVARVLNYYLRSTVLEVAREQQEGLWIHISTRKPRNWLKAEAADNENTDSDLAVRLHAW